MMIPTVAAFLLSQIGCSGQDSDKTPTDTGTEDTGGTVDTDTETTPTNYVCYVDPSYDLETEVSDTTVTTYAASAQDCYDDATASYPSIALSILYDGQDMYDSISMESDTLASISISSRDSSNPVIVSASEQEGYFLTSTTPTAISVSALNLAGVDGRNGINVSAGGSVYTSNVDFTSMGEFGVLATGEGTVYTDYNSNFFDSNGTAIKVSDQADAALYGTAVYDSNNGVDGIFADGARSFTMEGGAIFEGDFSNSALSVNSIYASITGLYAFNNASTNPTIAFNPGYDPALGVSVFASSVVVDNLTHADTSILFDDFEGDGKMGMHHVDAHNNLSYGASSVIDACNVAPGGLTIHDINVTGNDNTDTPVACAENVTSFGYSNFWNNGANDITQGDTSTLMSVDPAFVASDPYIYNPDATDPIQANGYSISSTSPLVDAGDPDVSYIDASDGSRSDVGYLGGPFSQSAIDMDPRIESILSSF